jgi:CheY-like chemotaxis protein
MKRRPKVLVVDDDPISLEVTRTRLNKAGYDVVVREDALGTSTAIAQEEPEIVLLDVGMPGISGEALAKLITDNPKRSHISVIFHSARSAPELDALAEKCRVLGAIPKTSDASLFQLQFERLLLARRPNGAPPSVPDPGAARRKSG